MIGIFAPDARLGTEVRAYITTRVFPSNVDDGATSPPPPPLSDTVRASFATALANGFTFRQTRPPPPKRFTHEDEQEKTLKELDLWPSAVLMLHPDGSGSSSSHGGPSVVAYSQGEILVATDLVVGL